MRPPFRNYPLSLRITLLLLLFITAYSMFPIMVIMVLNTLGFAEATENVLKGVIETPTEVNAFIVLQAVGSLGAFAVTAMAFSQLEAGNAAEHLHLDQKPAIQLLLLGVAGIIVAQPIISFLVEVCDKIPLPESLQSLKSVQQTEEAIMKKLMDFTSIPRLLLMIVVMAVIPALGEEMFFRGAIAGNLLRSRVSLPATLAISGFIFALGHLQFTNFVAIWLMGAYLGYLFYVSGSLWVPIAAHFVNNALAVILKYLFAIGVLSSDIANDSVPLWSVAISVVLFAAILRLLHNNKANISFRYPVFDEDEPIFEEQ
ncbi:MAG: CPBP family intramembrane metalloprotease [Chitinophagales bacterium]|nr:CPBP family intramembrane metalloprotease [Chitinophagales bacterium]